MKRWIATMAVMAAFWATNEVRAQDIAVGGEIGFGVQAGSGTNIIMPIGANVEWDINGALSLLGRMSFDVGLGAGNANIFYISPEVRYHFSEVFAGAYIGGYIGFGPASFSGSYVSFGATGGYQLMAREHFNIDINGQFGYGNIGSRFGRGSVLHFRPTVALRYKF